MPRLGSIGGRILAGIEVLRRLLGSVWRVASAGDASTQTITGIYGLATKPDQSIMVIGAGTAGNNYKISSSTDGIVWTDRYSTSQPKQLVWSGSSFVGISFGNNVALSTDGINWSTSGNIGFSSPARVDVVNNKICMNQGGFLWNSAASSPTGPYTKSVTSLTTTLIGVAYSPIRNLYLTKQSGFVPISSYYDGTYTSSDLVNWTQTQASFQYSMFYGMTAKSLTYHPTSDKFYISATFNSIWSTVDGTSWTKVRGNHWLNVSFNWLANNATGGLPGQINTNGFNTSSVGGCFRYFSSASAYIFGVGPISGFGGSFKNIQASDITNASTWSKMSYPTSASGIDVAYSPTLNRYVVYGGTSVDYSSNLTTWSTSTTGLTAPVPSISRMIWAGNQFVAVGIPTNNSSSITTSQAAVTSPDGITWTRRAVPGTARLDGTYHKYLVDIAYGNSTYVAVGGMNYSNPSGLTNGATVATSTDGATWTARQEGTYTNNYSYWQRNNGTYIHPNNLLGVVFAGNTGPFGSSFIAVGSQGLIVTSADNGATWTNRSGTSAIPEREYARPTFNGIAVGNGIVVAVGTTVYVSYDAVSPPAIITSIDNGLTWVRRYVAFGGYLTHILFDGTKFVAAGNYGLIVTSTDGINWTVVSHGGALNTINVLPDGRLMAAGEGGQMLFSVDGSNWTELSDADKKSYYVIEKNRLAISNTQVTALVGLYSNTASITLSTIVST